MNDKLFFTSDHHWSHSNIIKYCNRPFLSDQERAIRDTALKNPDDQTAVLAWRRLRISQDSVDRHDETLIENWNKVVPSDGVVYHLGDVAFARSPEQIERAKKLLKRLNGKIYVLKGNHDHWNIYKLSNRFEWVKDYFELKVHDKGATHGTQLIVLFHYAMVVFNKSHHCSILAYGHSHGTLNAWVDKHLPNARMLDVGVDSIAQKLSKDGLLKTKDYRPISYAELVSFLQEKKGQFTDHHV